MNNKKSTKKLVAYEIYNIIGNPFSSFFGIVFPILMLLIITNAIKGDVPKSMAAQANTSIFITMSLITPMAIIFLGYAATYSQELENDIPLRMGLFGFSERFMMRAKIIAQVIVLTAALAIYTLVSYTALDLEIPSFSGAATLVICLYLMGVIFFILAHGLANIFRKFGPTYALAMILYFGIMVLCGMMGIQTDQLPGFLQKIAALLPMSYVSSDFIDLWQGGSYHFMPLRQSFLFMGAISGILLLYANYKNRRTVG